MDSEQGKSCIRLKKYEKKQTWVKSPSGGIFQSVSFGAKEVEAGICSGQSLGLDLPLCFCWFAALRASRNRTLLWSGCFFTLPSFDIPGQGCLHSGQPCSPRGENCRLENLAKCFVAAVNCGSGLNIKGALSGFPPPFLCNFFSLLNLVIRFCCLQSFKKLDCSSVTKITHTSDLQIATSQEQRHLGAVRDREPCNE